tara:strand:- start:103 stop:477 length:375 start_codon:yes stop_codon:yes gene_type:complete
LFDLLDYTATSLIEIEFKRTGKHLFSEDSLSWVDQGDEERNATGDLGCYWATRRDDFYRRPGDDLPLIDFTFARDRSEPCLMPNVTQISARTLKKIRNLCSIAQNGKARTRFLWSGVEQVSAGG